MIHLAHKLPRDAYLACSGGIDSMVALNFMLNARKQPVVIHIKALRAYLNDIERTAELCD